MTGEPAGGRTEELSFRSVTGELVRAMTVVDSESQAGEFLVAQKVWLEDGTELLQLRVPLSPSRGAGYERLDNEILAGRRLHEATQGVSYPPAVSRLYGDEAASADPFALLEPYRGEPLQIAVRHMSDDDVRAFEVSLLTGLYWLEAAGIAHRGLSPLTVRWDDNGKHAQITDFSLCTVFGTPEQAIGPSGWEGSEQQPGGETKKLVTRADDIFAAGRLMYYARSKGESLRNRDHLADLSPLFGPSESRPTARELLSARPGAGDLVSPATDPDPRFERGCESFEFWRQEKVNWPQVST